MEPSYDALMKIGRTITHQAAASSSAASLPVLRYLLLDAETNPDVRDIVIKYQYNSHTLFDHQRIIFSFFLDELYASCMGDGGRSDGHCGFLEGVFETSDLRLKHVIINMV